MSLYKRNLEIIKDKYPVLYRKVLNTKVDERENITIKTKSEDYTVRVVNSDGINNSQNFIHSKYNPRREAKRFANNQLKSREKTNIIYGFGLGYHIEEILKLLDNKNKLYVFELNLQIFKLALKLRDLSKLLLDSRLILIVDNNEKTLASKMKPLLKENRKFISYSPSVKAIPNQYNKFKFIMENWNLKKNLKIKWEDLMNENYKKNIKNKDKDIKDLFNKYNNKPIIIVSAGPSLNKNKHLLKKINKKTFIFSVGSALKPLLKADIRPDMFCIIDPQDITYNQIKGFEDLDIPFVYMDTASAYTVSKYNGPKYIANSTKEETDNKTIDSGGSVATAVMDMAIKFGGNPIVFVGQDLAYTNNKHHADGTMYDKDDVKSLSNMRKIRGQNGEVLDTTLGLLSFKHWIENKIIDNPSVNFINATEGGAYIEGCKHMRLEEFIYGLL
ncbi:6-hydroxymethylpterin diphosphokinase MptE-like protein [Dethiothermospora halolimnae]|uniref:motility associated factor glycosyltransferase family protein n=1 Tax=Dethiothermospora halolimnae TaxID=3114390 RepID=UPI003CCB849D